MNKILITAGPTWIKIDEVRIFTNVATGSLGYEIAKYASARGFAVHLLLGYGGVVPTGKEKFRITRFKFYHELYSLLKKEISTKKYDAVFHSAAVADYELKEAPVGKIKSGRKELTLVFKPTKKIVDNFRRWNKNIFIVKFKFEATKNKEELLNIAHDSLLFSGANLIFANKTSDVINKHPDKHIGYILTRNRKDVTKIVGKDNIAIGLINKYLLVRY